MSDMSEAPKLDRAPKMTNPVNLLAGISVRVSVEVGSTLMTLSELAALEPGSVVALDRTAALSASASPAYSGACAGLCSASQAAADRPSTLTNATAGRARATAGWRRKAKAPVMRPLKPEEALLRKGVGAPAGMICCSLIA